MQEQSKTDKIKAEILELRRKLEEKEVELRTQNSNKTSEKLTNSEIARFSRQIILPKFGVQGQLKLKNAKVLIVGAGGLGCPAALHLAGVGIGQIGIVDYDDVEASNLHRQLLHTEVGIGRAKVDSAREAILRLNSGVKVTTYRVQLDSGNGLEIVREWDVVLDCSDNVATRYLLNDASVLLKKPLVSGSALQYEGQLTVYNHAGGPCYRCLFPQPPPPEAVTNCGDGGVFATVTGVIGTLQAMEAVKIIQGLACLAGRFLLYEALECTFRNVKLRTRKPECAICGDSPEIQSLTDYEQFCGMRATDKDSYLNILDSTERITVQEYEKMQETEHLLIDVRSPEEFEICRLPNSVNWPIKDILDEKKTEDLSYLIEKGGPIIFLCRRGNDSQLAVQRCKKLSPSETEIRDIVGGLHAWTRQIDPEFPIY